MYLAAFGFSTWTLLNCTPNGHFSKFFNFVIRFNVTDFNLYYTLRYAYCSLKTRLIKKTLQR